MAPKANPVTYAEDTLGVHKIYRDTVESSEQLSETFGKIIATKAQRRLLEESLADIEMNIVANERGNNPDMSQAAMDKHLKTVIQADGDHRAVRNQIRDLAKELDEAEAERSMVDADIRIGCARLSELGGYLQYLAAVKLAQPVVTISTQNQ